LSLVVRKRGWIILNNQETKEQRKSDYFVSLLLGCSTLPSVNSKQAHGHRGEVRSEDESRQNEQKSTRQPISNA
jgi:hypothetical protein